MLFIVICQIGHAFEFAFFFYIIPLSKNEIIEKVYNDFYGSIKQTYEEAKKIDSTIKYDDVKKIFWKK